ncbi:hypothetical protein AAC387_Pa04g1336 [Persea americana]
MDKSWMTIKNRMSKELGCTMGNLYLQIINSCQMKAVSLASGESARDGVAADEHENPDDIEHLVHDYYAAAIMNDEELDELCDNVEMESVRNFDKLMKDADQELYPGCKFTLLSFVIKLLHMKVLNKWSNKSFDTLLGLLKELLPISEQDVLDNIYEAKKFLRNLGLGYVPIHACKYDCILFWKENAYLEMCPVCEEPTYNLNDGKGKKIPHKILRYFPLTKLVVAVPLAVGLPIGENATRLASWLGVQIRMATPLKDMEKWDDIPSAIKAPIIQVQLEARHHEDESRRKEDEAFGLPVTMPQEKMPMEVLGKKFYVKEYGVGMKRPSSKQSSAKSHDEVRVLKNQVDTLKDMCQEQKNQFETLKDLCQTQQETIRAYDEKFARFDAVMTAYMQ